MPVKRLPDPPREIPLLHGTETLYEVDLSTRPSAAWRAAFLRPPARLIGAGPGPEHGRVGLNVVTVHFRTTPDRLETWLQRIDIWIAYANSVVEE
jgi:hypothetical protein